MNRRGFLKMLGAVGAAIVAKPLMPLAPEVAAVPVDFGTIVIGQWADYTNCSDFALKTSIHPFFVSDMLALDSADNSIVDFIQPNFNYLRTFDVDEVAA